MFAHCSSVRCQPRQPSICYTPGYFFKTFMSHAHIRIPQPQHSKLLAGVLSQNKAVAVLCQKAVVVELALRQAWLTVLPLPLKKTRRRTRKRARLQQYKADGQKTRWNTCGSVRGQYIKAGEPTVRESVDQNSLLSKQALQPPKHFKFVKCNQNASVMECRQQSEDKLWPNSVEFAAKHLKSLALVRFSLWYVKWPL